MSTSTPDLPTSLIIVATLLGPVLAVQAQKWIERFNERSTRKQRLFEKLMATRGAKISAEHVQALNMIDTTFYGGHVFGFHRRSKKEQAVLDAWKEYLDHLNTAVAMFPGGNDAWGNRNADLFTNLLATMGDALNYSFDRVVLKKGWYIPTAHGEAETEMTQVRKLAKQVLAGDLPVKMAVTAFPFDSQAVEAQKNILEKAGAALEAQKAMGEAIVGAINGQSVLNVKMHEKRN